MSGPKPFLTTSILVSAIVLVALTQSAAAQERSSAPDNAAPAVQDRSAGSPSARFAGAETTGMGGAAPVGHRQPTLKGLPDSARDIERPAVDPLGPLPQICNRC